VNSKQDILLQSIRSIPDFPSEGIVFRDITTLLSNPQSLNLAIELISQEVRTLKIDKVVGIEARGFIIGGAVAYQLGAGFVPLRKQGKLPHKTIQISYDLEYGSDVLEVHEDAILPAENILLIDDLIATGGTALAATDLIQQVGGHIIAAAFIIDLPDLGGSHKLRNSGIKTISLLSFDGH